MRKKTLILIISCFILLAVATGAILEWNCCKWENDCCCPNYRDLGLYLDEFLCVCSQGGAPVIYRECIYVFAEAFEYPNPQN